MELTDKEMLERAHTVLTILRRERGSKLPRFFMRKIAFKIMRARIILLGTETIEDLLEYIDDIGLVAIPDKKPVSKRGYSVQNMVDFGRWLTRKDITREEVSLWETKGSISG